MPFALKLDPSVVAVLLQLRASDNTKELYRTVYERIVLIGDQPDHPLAGPTKRWMGKAQQMGRVSTVTTSDNGTWAIAWRLDPDRDPTILVMDCTRLPDE